MAILVTLFLLLFSLLAQASSVYVVKPGDTLFAISRTYDVCLEYLAEYNSLTDPSRILVGQRLLIPGPSLEPDFQSREGRVERYSEEDLILLARLIYAEARGESLEGQIAVGAVVLNRVASPLFPGTIRDVIYQPNQFIPVNNGLSLSYTATNLEAARRALRGEDPSLGAIFFYNPRTSQALDFWRTRTVIKRIGNHNFAI